MAIVGIASVSIDVFLAIALIISGRPRVPIVCAERIVVSKAQVQHFPVSRGNGAVRIYQILHTQILQIQILLLHPDSSHTSHIFLLGFFPE